MVDLTKTVRVFTTQNLGEGLSLSLDGDTHHYLRNVMRTVEGQPLRIFNGRDGEFVGRVERVEKKHIELTLENRVREQCNPTHKIHLLFTPLKKERMDFLIEKSVELGATDLHPVLTQNTDVRKINVDRFQAQMIDAMEQCERMDAPHLHPLEDILKKIASWPHNLPLMAAIERMGTEPIPRGLEKDCALLVGPPGGFTAEEKSDILAPDFVHAVSLGRNILRSETAAIAGLSLLKL